MHSRLPISAFAMVLLGSQLGGCHNSGEAGDNRNATVADASNATVEVALVGGEINVTVTLPQNGNPPNDCPVLKASATANGIPMQAGLGSAVWSSEDTSWGCNPTPPPGQFTCSPTSFSIAAPSSDVDIAITDSTGTINISVQQVFIPPTATLENTTLHAGDLAKINFAAGTPMPDPATQYSASFDRWIVDNSQFQRSADGISFVVPDENPIDGVDASAVADDAGSDDDVDASALPNCESAPQGATCDGELDVEFVRPYDASITTCTGVASCHVDELWRPLLISSIVYVAR